MKKPQVHVTLTPEKLSRLNETAEVAGVSGPTLAAVIISAFADVHPNKVFNALGSIPESYKRPANRKLGVS